MLITWAALRKELESSSGEGCGGQCCEEEAGRVARGALSLFGDTTEVKWLEGTGGGVKKVLYLEAGEICVEVKWMDIRILA